METRRGCSIDGVGLSQALFEHGDGDLIGDIIAGSHDGLHRPTEFSPVGYMVTEHLTGGNVRIPRRSATRDAWVPLPAPGGPINSNLMRVHASRVAESSCRRQMHSTQNALVVAHCELGFNLLHRL